MSDGWLIFWLVCFGLGVLFLFQAGMAMALLGSLPPIFQAKNRVGKENK